MIKFINPELFHLDTTLVQGEHSDYFKTVVSSAIKVTTKQSNDKVRKVVTTIISDKEDITSSDTNCVIKTAPTANGTMRVSINAFERNDHDTDIYLVAIPFNGFIEEIEKSFQYRIYRGVMVKTDKRTIEFQGNTYKKVAYMIVVPNGNMLEDNNKYHEDELTLKVSSYNLETIEEDKHDTIKSTTTITFTKSETCGTDSKVECNVETVDPINPDDFKGKIIFPIYAKKSHDTDSNTSDNSEGNTDEKNGYTKKHKKDKYYNKNPYDRMKETKKKNKRR